MLSGIPSRRNVQFSAEWQGKRRGIGAAVGRLEFGSTWSIGLTATNRKSLKKRSFLKLFLLAGVISVSDAIDGMHRFVILPDEDNRAFPLFSRYGRSHGCGQGADAAF